MPVALCTCFLGGVGVLLANRHPRLRDVPADSMVVMKSDGCIVQAVSAQLAPLYDKLSIILHAKPQASAA